ncbi:Uncharacterized protein DAT39_019777 [Clarias magur]|uniref:Uncharacterized protein n=1 Tax=Clarias magur TaxID=1594786 RepID=A0A8J4U4C3_CLAMG|nr:Uncharacterized protein DAT39_019777 [Clarias magur]
MSIRSLFTQPTLQQRSSNTESSLLLNLSASSCSESVSETQQAPPPPGPTARVDDGTEELSAAQLHRNLGRSCVRSPDQQERRQDADLQHLKRNRVYPNTAEIPILAGLHSLTITSARLNMDFF